MSDPHDWNAKTIAEFRANEGRVGGQFEGAPLVLLHHVGRTSGRQYEAPTMYLAHETDPDVIYVFASKGGAPTDPDWYRAPLSYVDDLTASPPTSSRLYRNAIWPRPRVIKACGCTSDNRPGSSSTY